MNITNQSFRLRVVSAILSIKESYEEITRNSAFLAISIFDLFLLKSSDSELAGANNTNLFAITCLLLAWKFQGDSHPKISSIYKYLQIVEQYQSFYQGIISLQQKILFKIDFQIPLMTVYDSLDTIVDDKELKNDQNRRDVVKTMKVIMTAIKLTNQLSFDPSLGQKLHQITKKTTVTDLKAKNIYRACLKFLQNKQNQRQSIKKPCIKVVQICQ